jgi:hypothetical protein
MKSKALVLGGFALFASVGSALAAGLPAEHQAGSVSYVTGGVSDDEAAAFKSMKGSYPLAIELDRRQPGGERAEFTSDANVKVIDRGGNVVLDAKADGPFMLVKLAPGKYRVQATLGGRTLEKAVTVGAGGHAQATLAFPPEGR